jgi:hypothetical protein
MSEDRRKPGGRRTTDSQGKVPVPVGEAKDAPREDDTATGEAGVTALGEGHRRGLKGGQETLQRARTTYLGAEFSGEADRRPKKGRITKTEI